MSWSAFDEFKTFATKIKDQCKRKKDWNKPTSKKQTSSDRSSVESEKNGIDRFSSDEEQEEETFAHRSSNSGKRKIEHPSKRRSPRTHNPRKRIRTDNDFSELIDDTEETPDDNQPNIKPTDISNAIEDVPKCLSASEEAGKLMETLDVMIKDFNSSDEDEKVQKDEELDIDIPTPTPTPSSDHCTPTPTVKQSDMPELSKTGSEWLKKVQSIASTSTQEGSTVVKMEVDSAKKTKQKFKRSGLAEQLQKVINRENSEKTFWTHKQTSGNQDTASTIDVQILSVHVQYLLYITRCCILSSNDGNSDPAVIDVVFNAESGRQLVPRVGCAVRIHPPWQKLHPPSSPYPVLLCTYHCEKLSTPPGSPLVDLASLPDISIIPNQSKEGSSHLNLSPQKVFKPTKLLFESDNTIKSSTNVNSDLKKALPSIAQAIETQGGCSGGSVSFQAVIQRMYRRKVKIARDKGIESPGHLVLSKSLITRARNGEDKEEIRWTFLVQDTSLNLCEVQIPAEFASQDEWTTCKRNGEGNKYSFVDLTITQRTNRTRSPGLFTLVDSLWCTESNNHCQDDKNSQIHSSQETPSQPSWPLSIPPSYCYILTAQEDSHVTPCDDQDLSCTSSLYKTPTPVSLHEIFKYHDAPKRFSVWCRVICSRPSSSTRTLAPLLGGQSWAGQLFVTDASLHHDLTQSTQETKDNENFAHYLKIKVRPSYVMSESINKAVLEAGSVLYFQDIVCSGIDGQVLYADSYTTIKKGATDPCQADLDMGEIKAMPLSVYTDLVALKTQEFIQPLSSTSSCESLCKVEGIIQGVDEESACCWLECTVCACQDLLERSGLPYYCPVCKSDVSDPITKTNLDVIIKCDSWKDAQVKVKLLQATIEQLLPVSYQDSDQGYDIERVLGKCLGPLYCYIEEHGKLTVKLAEIVVSL